MIASKQGVIGYPIYNVRSDLITEYNQYTDVIYLLIHRTQQVNQSLFRSSAFQTCYDKQDTCHISATNNLSFIPYHILRKKRTQPNHTNNNHTEDYYHCRQQSEH